MEAVNLGYSMKNIPTAQPREYSKHLLEKTESFLRRVRWKAYHFLKPATKNHPPTNRDTFGFHTTTSPPPIKELDQFEDKMLTIIQNIAIEFKKVDNAFQKHLAQDLAKIKNDDKLLIAADKGWDKTRIRNYGNTELRKRKKG